MNSLKHDADGFLVGKRVATDDDAVRLLGAIKGDTGHILAAIHAMPRQVPTRPISRAEQRQPKIQTVSTAKPANNDDLVRRASLQPRDSLGRVTTQPATQPASRAQALAARDAKGRFTGRETPADSKAAAVSAVMATGAMVGRVAGAGQITAQLATQPASRAQALAANKAPATAASSESQAAQAAKSMARGAAASRRDNKMLEASRDAKGRFTGGGKPTDSMAAGGGAVGAISATLGRTVGTVSGAEQFDPMIAAANEVKGIASAAADVVTPLKRGLGKLAGRTGTTPELREERTQTGLLRRMVKALQSRGNQAPAGGDSGRGDGALGMLTTMLGPLLTLGGLLPKLLGGAVSLGGGALGAAGKLGGGLLKGAGGLLKRVPLLGALIEGGLGLLSDREIANDPSLSPEEKRSKRIANVTKTAGSMGGALLGGALGSMILPGIGTAVGAAVGAWLGDEGGELLAKPFEGVLTWFQGLDLKASWDATMGSIGETWNSVTATLSEWVSSLSTTWSDLGAKVGDWLSKLPGADAAKNLVNSAKETAAPYLDAAKEKAGRAWNVLKDGANSALSAAKDTARPVVDAAKEKVASVGAQAKAGYDVARGTTDATATPAPAGALQSGARVAGKIAGGMTNAATLAREAVASGITSPNKLAMFMGQMAHESGGFATLQENLNYSSVGRIRKVFGKNKAVAGMTDEQLKGLVNNPDALANTVYGGRMGNTEEGDGAKFKGRGFVQLTGKDNYAAAGKALGLDLVNNPELAADPTNASKIAAWYWKSHVEAKGADGSVESATKAINGGTHGLEDRRQQTQKFAAMIESGALPGGNVAAPTPVPSSPAPAVMASAAPTAVEAAPVAVQPAVAATAARVKTLLNTSRPPVAPAQAPQLPSQDVPKRRGAVAAVAAAPVAVQPAVAATAARVTPPPSLPAPVTVKPPAEVQQVTLLNTSRPPAPPAQAPQLPSQDVPERGIAHIVTGGIAAALR